MSRRLFGITVVGGFCILSVLIGMLWRHHLVFVADLHRQGAEKLAVFMAGAIDEADREHDDLTIQSHLRRLGQLPGVIRAEVMTPDHRVRLSHDPTRVGQREPVGRRRSSHILRVRRTLGLSPDHFILELSTAKMDHRLQVSTGILLAAAVAASAWLALIVVLVAHDRRVGVRQWEDARLALSAHAGVLSALEKDREAVREQLTLCIEAALSHLNSPILILDQRLRIAGCSPPAAQALEASSPSLIGKFWYEVPLLSDCGTVLEEVLQTPRHSREAAAGPWQLRIQSIDRLEGRSLSVSW